MGDEEHGRPHLAPHAEQELLHREPRLRIQGAERLVHEHHARPVDQHTRDADTLLHASAELAGVRALEAGEADEIQVVASLRRPFRRPDPAHLEAELDVGEHGLPREQRMLLKDHSAIGAGLG